MILNMKEITFDEKHESEKGWTTLYFIAPKEMLQIFGKKYPEAASMEISLEFPTGLPFSNHASVMVSPTEEIDGVMTDFDWFSVELADDDITALFELAAKSEIDVTA